MLPKLILINEKRRSNASVLDSALEKIDEVTLINQKRSKLIHSYHLYSQLFDNRDQLKNVLNAADIDAKIHYPKPIHLQPAAKSWGYKPGSFPKAEIAAAKTLSLPVHEFIKNSDLIEMCERISHFYSQKSGGIQKEYD